MTTTRRRYPLATVFAASAVLLAVLVTLGPPEAPRTRLAVWTKAGAERDVKILRDDWGVPHVFGKTDADAAYGLAWAHAEDDFPTIQARLLAARGRLASVLGQEGAASDYFVALLRVRDTVEGKYATDLSPETRAICEAYAEGINRFAALNPQKAWPALYPVTGKDVVAGFVQGVPLFFDLDKVLQELMAPTRWRPVSRKGVKAASLPEPADSPAGSNTIAVAPSRSADGFTRLAVNSHQPWDGPLAWYEAHLHSEEGWDMTGGLFPGAPLVLHGRLRRGGLDLPLGGAPDTLHAVYTRRDEDGRRRGIAGDSYVLLVEWNREGRVSSRSIHQYGSATSDERSPHHADQAPLFARGELKPVYRDEADVRAHLEREYRPGDSPGR